MPSLNKAILIGYLGHTPEYRQAEGDKSMIRFIMATNERIKGRAGEMQDFTQWHNVVAWDRLADNCATFLKKGSLAYVEGRFQSRKYEGKDGQNRIAFSVVANKVVFLDPKKADTTNELLPGDDEPPF